MNDILWLLNLVGVSVTPGMIAASYSIGALGAIALKFKYDSIQEEHEQERIKKNFEKMEAQKKKIALDLWDEEKHKQNEQVKNNYENMLITQKEKQIEDYKLIDVKGIKTPYSGIKCPTRHALLLGHNSKGEPVWGLETNYIVCGQTGSGKSRLIHGLILNYLANKQGLLYLIDLKETDLKLYRNKMNVSAYCSDLERVKEVVELFKAEYERRATLVNSNDCIDIDDYNLRFHKNKVHEAVLLIEEFADIADIYKDRNGRPIGVYADLIKLARKCRAFNMRIVLVTQRPSADVITGTLKANCSLIGMRVVNELNSKIILDSPGCERLEQGEGLMILKGKLEKIFSYWIDDNSLKEFISKLK